MKRYSRVPALIALLISCLIAASHVHAEPSAASKQAFAAFLKGFANADIEAMAKSYAEEVTVKRGSALLQKEYGGLGGDDGDEKDKLVRRADLLAAYKTAITKLGGKTDWTERAKNLLRAEVLHIDEDSKDQIKPGLTADRFFGVFGARPGDVLAVVNPAGDTAVFHLREIDGTWRVIGDYWD